jgi:putative hydrolase of the HAD superfamily
MTAGVATGTISTVLLDADGVFQETFPGWRRALLELLGSRAAAEGDAFLFEVFMAERRAVTGIASFADGLADVIRRFGLPDCVEEILAVSTRIEVDDGLLAAVQRLRGQGITCCVASNQQRHRALYMASELGYARVFDRQFYSCDLGLAKPDPAYFSAIINRLDVSGSAVLFVDDNPENVRGALVAGIRAEHFPRGTGLPALQRILQAHGLLRT